MSRQLRAERLSAEAENGPQDRLVSPNIEPSPPDGQGDADDERSHDRETPKPNRYAVATICATLVLAVAVIYGQTANHGFIRFDDNSYIYANPNVVSGLTVRSIAWAFTACHSANWHPLTWISHQLDWQLYGDWAGGHHLTSAALHAATAVILFLVLRAMTGQLWPSALVAAVFAVHPLRVESVAWAAERKDVLSGLFFVLTIGAYARYCRLATGWTGVRFCRYMLVMVLFALGLMAKPMLVTVPAVLLLLDYWPLKRFASTRVWILVVEKLPLLALSLASCVVTLIAQVEPITANRDLALPWRLANTVVAYVGYLGQFLYPLNLALLYPHPRNELPIWKIIACLLVFLATSATVVAVRRKYPYLIVGWLWYLGMLVPVIGLVQVGSQAMADRYTYLPQIGIVIALVWGADELRRHWAWRPKVVGFATASVLLGLMATACLQTTYWRDGLSLWKRTLDCTVQNYLAHECYAEALSDLEQIDAAIAEYRMVVKTYGAAPKTLFNLGVALDRAGRTKESIPCYEESLRVQPEYPEAHFNLANALVNERRLAEAIDHYDEAIRQKPDYVKAYNNLAWLLATTDVARGDDPERAVPLAQRACQLAGDDSAVSLDVLAAAYASAGKFAEAVATAEKATRAASLASNADLARQIEARLKLYRQNRPYLAPVEP